MSDPEVLPAKQSVEVLRFGGFSLTRQGVRVTGHGVPTYEDWVTAISFVKTIQEPVSAWLGELINLGRSFYGDLVDQVIDATEWTEGTAANYAWVMSKVPAEVRRFDAGLSMTHHQLVAGLPVPEQKRCLDAAAEGHWSTARLQREVRVSNGEPVALWVIVSCTNESDRQAFLARMQAENRRCK